MKLYYGLARAGNFGDDLNPWLLPKVFPKMFDDDARDILVGIGTLLNHRVPDAERISVFGSGFGYGRPPSWTPDRWRFYAVRGPVTARRLGLDPSISLGDPAYLVADFVSGESQPDPVGQAAFIPHFESAQSGMWPRVAEEAGLRVIDPRWPVERVLREMQRSPMVVTEAMHGAIVADTLRIPWVAVRPNAPKHRAKWEDWAQSVGVKVRFGNLGVSSLAEMRATVRDHGALWLKGALFRTPFWRYAVDTSPQTEDVSFHDPSQARRMLSRHLSPELRTPQTEGPEPRSEPLGLGDGHFFRKAVKALSLAARRDPQLSPDGAPEERRTALWEAAERLMVDRGVLAR